MRCFVCGTELVEAEACGECGTSAQVQKRLMDNTGRNRFLFGRVKQGRNAVEPAPKPKPKPAKMARPMHPDPEPVVRAIRDADLIRNRDADLFTEVEAPAVRRPPLRKRTFSYLLDVAVCMLLNFWIFQLVVWTSGRGALPLFNFSLVPILFVLLCFTVLYFWLFMTVFGKSLGRILLETWELIRSTSADAQQRP